MRAALPGGGSLCILLVADCMPCETIQGHSQVAGGRCMPWLPSYDRRALVRSLLTGTGGGHAVVGPSCC